MRCAKIVGTIRLLLFIIVPGFLVFSSILPESSATSNTDTSEPISNANTSQLASSILTETSNECCTPILLAPIATSGNNVYLVWTGNDTGHLEILFRASSDNAQTFGDKINLSNTPNVNSIDMQIATSGNYVYISWWEDYGNGTRIPLFRASNDNGQTFEPVLSPSENGPIASPSENGPIASPSENGPIASPSENGPIASENNINSGY